jgi:hypothetical protein
VTFVMSPTSSTSITPDVPQEVSATRKSRPGTEWLAERVFRVAAQRLVAPLARLGVRPEAVVVTHTLLGLVAARQIARGERLAPALLLQIKTVLDNADGQLARATGRTTATGRYLDTEMDTVLNAALLFAVDRRLGIPALAVLSLILTADFLLERDYREARGEVFREPPALQDDDPRLLAALEGAYRLWFVPQERLLTALFEARLRAVGGADADRVAYTPRLATHVVANMGLSTQLAVLGALVALGRPRAYLGVLAAQAGVLVGLQLWREDRVRRARKGGATWTDR